MKYKGEKVLHEIIRDIPECANIESAFERGMITSEEYFRLIAQALHDDKLRAAIAANKK